MNLDNIFSKAKEVFETAYKKADDVVTVQKQKFDISSMENKLSKDFEELGRLCFEEMKKGAFADNQAFCDKAEEITLKCNQIDEMKKEVFRAKNKKQCEKCGAAVEKNSQFCSSCGAKQESDVDAQA